MTNELKFKLIRGTYHLLVMVSVVNGADAVLALSGTWTESTGDGAWSNSANWSGGTIADGAGNTADFSTVNVDAAAVSVNYPGFYRNAVEVNTPRTIGNMIFGDSNPASPGGWEVYSNDYALNIVTLAGATPTITVNPLGPIDTGTLGSATPELIDDVIFRPNLAGTSGFTKTGGGTLTLAETAKTITGPININQGTLRTNSFLPAGATISIANGATLSTNTTLNALDGRVFNVAPGATANIIINANVELGRFVADNATLNVNIATGGSIFTPSGNWNLSGSPTALNITAPGGGIFRIAPNNNSAQSGIRNFNPNTFIGTVVTVDNTTVITRTNSTGNDVNIGALVGSATAILDGGGNGGGTSTARYHIGQLNTNTTFAGTIQNTSTGSILIDKVGTGTLTLSGNLTYSTTNIAAADQRGGITRVTAGTLKLTGPAAIPGGITDATLGDLYTTIDLRTGAMLDVSTTDVPYSTAPLQQLIGPGTVVGSYTHDEGRIRAADVPVGNSNNVTPTAGTITFANNLSFTGSGEIVYDMGLNPAAGNDRIQVNGTTTLTGSTTKVTPNFLGGVVPATGTYTILNSTGGFVGTPTGWTVSWPGRGAGPTVVANGTLLQFDAVPVVGGANLNWTGAVSGAWDINTTQNWRNSATNAADRYFNDDNVTFADTHSGGTPVSNFSVTITTNVAPRSVTVDSTNNYSFIGPGVISGTSTFTKRGSSTLTMQKANTFSGAAAIEAGTVDVGGQNGALGTGILTMSGGSIFGTMNGLTNSGLVLASGNNTIQSNNATSLGLPALSGSGNLTIVSADDDLRVDLAGAANPFMGHITFAPDGITGLAMTIRVAGAANDLPTAAVTLTNGSKIANRNGSSTIVPIELGSLSGDSSSSITGFTGGSSAPGTNWVIGGLNTSTEFAGSIVNGAQVSGGVTTVVPTHLTKVGTGTLTLSGANLYTGDTTITAGVLSLATTYLADSADVYLASDALLNLSHGGTDVIDSLFINGVSQATGTWGSLASSADHKSALITGTGLLQVTTFVQPPLLVGDYNGNNVVDAADYVIWRDALGSATALANRDPLNTGNVSQADYNSWRNNFGATLPGAGSLAAEFGVPEPSAFALVSIVAWCLLPGRRNLQAPHAGNLICVR